MIIHQADDYHSTFNIWKVGIDVEGCENMRCIQEMLSIAKSIDKHVNMTIQINSLFVY